MVKPLIMTAVLRKIADFHWKHGTCWASVATIARQVKAPVKSVQRALLGLESLELISGSERRGRYGTSHREPLYQKIEALVPGSIHDPGSSATDGLTHDAASSAIYGQTQYVRSLATVEASVRPYGVLTLATYGQQSEGEKKKLKEREDRSADRLPTDPLSGIAPKERNLVDLSELNWEHVFGMAEAVLKRVSAITDDDLRAWVKYAVLAETSFGECWLMDAAEAVVRGHSVKSRQAHFVQVLKLTAAESVEGMDEETFLKDLVARIEIPDRIWRQVRRLGRRDTTR